MKMMDLPNRELMRRYGTEHVFITKLAGGLPIAARIAAGALGVVSARGYQREQRQQALQARAMNDQFRLLLAMRMDPTIMGMEHTRVPVLLPPGNNMPLGLTEGMVRLASETGADRARFEKEAGIGQALAGAGGVLKAVGRAAVKPLVAAGGAAKRSAGAVRSATSNAYQGGVQASQAAAATRRAAAVTKAEASTAARMTAAETRAGGKATGVSGGRVAPQPAAVPPAPAPVATAAPMPASPVPPPSATPAAPQAPAASAGEVAPATPKAPGFMERAGLNKGLAWKIPLAGAAVAGSYGAYRGGKAALNYMGQEPGPSVYNRSGAVAAGGVNQYGVPDRVTS